MSCKVCPGTERVKCSLCNGSGINKKTGKDCYECDGSGRVSCTEPACLSSWING